MVSDFPKCLSVADVAEGRLLFERLLDLQKAIAEAKPVKEAKLRVLAAEKKFLADPHFTGAENEYEAALSAYKVLVHGQGAGAVFEQGSTWAAMRQSLDREISRHIKGKCAPFAVRVFSQALPVAEENLAEVTKSEAERVRELTGEALGFNQVVAAAVRPVAKIKEILSRVKESPESFHWPHLVNIVPKMAEKAAQSAPAK